MEIRTCTRLRGAISLMMLLALCSTLLPAQGAAAQIIPRITLTPQQVKEKLYDTWILEHFDKTKLKGEYTETYTKFTILNDQVLNSPSLDLVHCPSTVDER